MIIKLLDFNFIPNLLEGLQGCHAGRACNGNNDPWPPHFFLGSSEVKRALLSFALDHEFRNILHIVRRGDGLKKEEMERLYKKNQNSSLNRDVATPDNFSPKQVSRWRMIWEQHPGRSLPKYRKKEPQAK